MTPEELVEKVARDFYERTGYEIKLPSECSLDDEERGRYVAIVAAIRIALEAAATHVDHSLCDAAEDAGLFMAHRNYFADAIRALIPEEQ